MGNVKCGSILPVEINHKSDKAKGLGKDPKMMKKKKKKKNDERI